MLQHDEPGIINVGVGADVTTRKLAPSIFSLKDEPEASVEWIGR